MTEDRRNRPLRVAQFIGTRLSDPERGPQVRISPTDAQARLLVDGELAWVYGPRRHELAEVTVDPGITRGDVALRDLICAAPSDVVRVVKPDLDERRGRPGEMYG